MQERGTRPRWGAAIAPPIRWPKGIRAAVCLTFDLDAETAWISRDPENLRRLAVMSQGAYGPKVGVPLLLDLLARNGLHATFFVPGWTAERYPDVVADIHRQGHEVGHHGYLHEALEGKTRDEEEEILVKGVRILEGITGQRPVGYRALVELPTTWILDDGPYFAYGIRPPLYRQIYPPGTVLATWKDEFRGMHALSGAFTLILHPQFIGRPSRVLMLQALIDYVRTFSGVWLAHGLQLARWVASDAASAGTDGRPLTAPAACSSTAPATGAHARASSGALSRRPSRRS